MVTPVELAGLKAVTSAFANIVVGRLDRVLASKYQSWKNIEMESTLLKRNLLMLAAVVDDQQRDAPRTAVERAYGEEIRELTHDIEDCIERFLHLITCKPGASWTSRSVHAIMTTGPRLRFAAKIKKLRNRVDEARERALKAVVPVEAVQAVEYVPNVTPIGITEATKDIRKLLDVEPNMGANIQAAAHLRVVALVGFGGSGKTILAKVVYDKVNDEQVIPCAWVEGHSLDNMDCKGIQQNIHDQLGPGGMENRYLIVIDGIKDKHSTHWDTLKNGFSGNGRIIVTTISRSIANKCCTCTHRLEEDRRAFGFVYNMRRLGEEESKQIALLGRHTPELASGAEELLKQCGGLPLALYSVGSRLSCENETELTGEFCDILGNNLGRYLEREEDEPNFAKLRCVLRENYTSLSDYTVRTCLLYLGIFPMDQPLKKNVIIRRWLAEGYARHPEGKDKILAEENFQTFMKRSIILPVEPTSNPRGKLCKTHSIMHVFVLHKSMSMKFIMPFGDEHKKVRHFFIHGRNSGMVMSGVDLSCVRSLTVLGKAGDAISNFSKYKLTRVLDLEGCTDVKDRHVKGICKLWNLRYLSLGPNITAIPKEIAQLKFLETLDVSKTSVNVLPVEAIGLPCLIHLIGKFKFEDPMKTESLPKECMLETVAGFVADKSQGFLQLMDRMKRLNKVKIWCTSDQTGHGLVDMNNHLSKAIQNYIEADMHKGTIRSLSLYFQSLPQGSLTALDQLCQHHSSGAGHSYHLTSLKLSGNSSSATLSNFLALFRDLKKLSISTTMSMTQHLLSVLGELPFLLFLKMTANSIDDGFVIQDGKFRSLNRLCLVLKVVGTPILTIEDGARPQIISLQLICKDLVGLSGAEIMPLRELKEIALHPDVDDKTRKVWEAEASNHHNKPYVVSMSIQDVPEEANSSEEETNNAVSTEEPTHGDHIIRQEPTAVGEKPVHDEHIIQEEPAAVEEKPALEDHIIRDEPAALEAKPAHGDHIIRQEPATVEENPAHEDHIIRDEPAAAEEKPAHDEHIIQEEPVAVEEKPAHEDHIIRDEPAASEEKPAHEDHIIQEEPAAVEAKPAPGDHIIRQEQAAVEKKPAHEDHIILEELAAAEEEPAHEDHIIRDEPATRQDEPAVATRSTIHFANSTRFHVNGAHEAGDKEALVLGAA